MTKQDLFQECKVVLIFENWPVHASVTLFPCRLQRCKHLIKILTWVSQHSTFLTLGNYMTPPLLPAKQALRQPILIRCFFSSAAEYKKYSHQTRWVKTANSLRAPGWLSQLSICLWLGSWSQGPGIESRIGLPAQQEACFPLSHSPCLYSLSLCQMNK